MEFKKFSPRQLQKAIEIEMQKTDDPSMAARIALTKLKKDPEFYEKMEKAEEKQPKSGKIEYMGYVFDGLWDIKPSKAKGKKAAVLGEENGKYKIFHFGDSKMKHNYSDEAREAATARHKKNLEGNDARAKAFRVYWNKYWKKGGSVKKTDERTEKDMQKAKDKQKDKPMKKSFIKIFDNMFVPMDKAKPTKYYKRVPKSTGKGYDYYYTKDQYDKAVKDKKEEKTEKKGGLLSGIMSFFGFKDEKKAKEKVKQTYTENKNSLKGVDIGTFTDYMNEYLSNKDKWDKKLQKKEVTTVDKETGKIEKKKATDKKTTVPKKGTSWNLSLMRKISGIVAPGGQKERKEPNEYKENETITAGNVKIGIGSVFNSRNKTQKEPKTYIRLTDNPNNPEGKSFAITLQDKKTGEIIQVEKEWFNQRRISEVDTSKTNKPVDLKKEKESKDNFKTMPEVGKSKDAPDYDKIYEKLGEKHKLTPDIKESIKTFVNHLKKENVKDLSEEEAKRAFKGKVGEAQAGKRIKEMVDNGLTYNMLNIKQSDKSAVTSQREQKNKEKNEISSSDKESYAKGFSELKDILKKKSEIDEKANTEIQSMFPKKDMKDLAGRSVGHDQQIDETIKMFNYLKDKPNMGFPNKEDLKSDIDKIEKRKRRSKDSEEKLKRLKKLYDNYDKELSSRKSIAENIKKRDEILSRAEKEKSQFEKRTKEIQKKLEEMYKKASLEQQKNIRKLKDDIDYGRMQKAQNNKPFELLIQELQKAKKAPIGTVSGKYKKVAEGKWVPVDGEKKEKQPQKDDKKKDKKKDEDKPEESKKETIKNAIKKVISIFADALSERDVVQPTGAAAEQAGEEMKAEAKEKVRQSEIAAKKKKQQEEVAKQQKKDKQKENKK